MSKILITGGAGYVGAVLVPYLLDKGHDITVLDLMIYGDEVLKKNSKLKIVKGDIRDQKLLKKLLPNQETVIHLACISNDPSFELNPELGKSINLDAFDPLVALSKKNLVKRFIYASSSSVYGVKEEKNVDETMTLQPLTDYSKFKAECEKILIGYESKNFIPIIIRPATVCGFSPRQRMDVVVNILTNLAFNNRKMTVYGGDQLRPNIHIQDMVRAYDYLINAPQPSVSSQIFNAGYKNQTVMELATIVKNVIGSDVSILKSTSNDKRSYHISSKKIEKVLGFKTEKTIENAVTDLKNAFEKKLFTDSLNNEKYFNIKRMNNIKLI